MDTITTKINNLSMNDKNYDKNYEILKKYIIGYIKNTNIPIYDYAYIVDNDIIDGKHLPKFDYKTLVTIFD